MASRAIGGGRCGGRCGGLYGYIADELIRTVCKTCGKEFYRTEQHAYKTAYTVHGGGKYHYYCSYHCMRAAQAQKEAARKGRAKPCPICGAPVISSHALYCPTCREEVKRARDTKIKSRAQHQRREGRKAAGLCTRCGKRPPRAGFFTCEACAESEASRKRSERGGETV